MARIFIILGFILLIIGLCWPWLHKVGLGHLPGDIVIKRANFTLYFPLATCIIISLIITLIFWLIRR